MSSAKTTRPPYSPETVDRPRLYDRLDRWQTYRAVVIHAPAGYGKSTLVSRWIDVSGHATRSGWLSLDEGDSDPRRFTHGIVAALDGCLAGVREAMQPVLQDRHGDAERVASGLLAVLEDFLATPSPGDGGHVMLVLDDLQRAESSQVEALVQRLVEFGPHRLHLLILTRQATGLPLTRLYAHGKILDLDKAALSFTTDEIGSYLRAHHFLPASTDDVTLLARRTEGWVSALRLATLSMDEPGSVSELLERVRGDRDWPARFLTEEVLDRQEPAMRSFLLKTSILDGFDAGLCRAITGMDDAGARLAAIAGADLFLVEVDRQRGWFRYHDLFKELLQERMKQLLSENEVAELHRRAGSRLAADGQLEPALRHLLAGGADDEAADLAERHMVQTITRDPFVAMRLFDLLTADIWQRRPRLLLERCRLAMIMDDRDTTRCAEQAAELLVREGQTPEDSPSLPATLLVLRGAAALIDGDVASAAAYTDRALPHVADLDDFYAGTLWFIRIHISDRAGDHAALREAGARALDSFARADFLIGSVAVQRHLARCHMERGESQAATHLLNTLLEGLPRDRPDITYELWWLTFVAAENCYWQDDLARAREHQGQALALARRLQDESLILWSRAMADVYDAGESDVPPADPRTYEHLARVASRGAFDLLIDLDIRRLVAAGRVAEAWASAQSIDIDPANPSAFGDRRGLVPYLRAAIAGGVGLSGLTPVLKDATAVHARRGTRLIQLHLLALTAWQQARLRQRQKALATLGQAASLARETGYVRVLLDIPELKGLLTKVDRPLGSAARRTTTTADRAGLTARELQILQLLAADRTYQEIGGDLVLSVNTVRTHVRHLYRKLSVSRRAEAVDAAHRLGILGDRRHA